MTARRTTWAPIGPQYEVALGDWTEPKTVIPEVVTEYLISVGDGAR
jgi:hypothetical protein